MTLPKLSHTIEHTWVTEAHITAYVVLVYHDNLLSHRCGYVEVPAITDAMQECSVHGGVTYHSKAYFNDNLVVGFDCHHYNDATIETDYRPAHLHDYATLRSFNYTFTECEKLATQLKTIIESSHEI